MLLAPGILGAFDRGYIDKRTNWGYKGTSTNGVRQTDNSRGYNYAWDNRSYLLNDMTKEQIEQFYEDYRRTVGEECAPDEIHCSCVPLLRLEIETLKEKTKGLEKERDILLLRSKILETHYRSGNPGLYAEGEEHIMQLEKAGAVKVKIKSVQPLTYSLVGDEFMDDCLDNITKDHRHVKENCVAYQEGGIGCPDCYCDSTCKDDSCPICGGNTPERIDEQITWMENTMRTTSLKTIYLTEEELKQAIANYIRDRDGKLGPNGLYMHLTNNKCTMEWADKGEFVISIDGEIED